MVNGVYGDSFVLGNLSYLEVALKNPLANIYIHNKVYISQFEDNASRISEEGVQQHHITSTKATSNHDIVETRTESFF